MIIKLSSLTRIRTKKKDYEMNPTYDDVAIPVKKFTIRKIKGYDRE